MPRPRLHKSSIVAAYLLVGVFVLLLIPGRVVDYQPGSSTTFEHGWPGAYLRRQPEEPTVWTTVNGQTLTVSSNAPVLGRSTFPSQLPRLGIPWLSAENWRLWNAYTENEDQTPRWQFSATILLWDIGASILAIVGVVAAWEFRRRRRPRLLSFAIAELLAAMTVVSLTLAYLVHLHRGYQREVQLLAARSPNTMLWCEDKCVAPVWIRSLIGERFLPAFAWRVGTASASGLELTDANAVRNELATFPFLDTFELSGTIGGTGHFRYSELQSLSQLKTLKIAGGPRLDDQDVQELAHLTGLTTLVLDERMVSNQAGIPRLKASLPDCNIVDAEDDW